MEHTPTIIDSGRGPQLATKKVTVQDLLPAFKAGRSDADILAWYPQLGLEEVRLLREYYVGHQDEVLAAEARIAAEHDELRRTYRRVSPLDGLPPEERRAFLERKLTDRRGPETNGVHGPA